MNDKKIVMENGILSIERSHLMQISNIKFSREKHEGHYKNPCSQLGVWVDGEFSWVHSSEWTSRTYMVGNSPFLYSEARNDRLSLTIKIDEALHPGEPLYFKRIVILNDEKVNRNIRLFFYQNVSRSRIRDTAFFAPKENVMFHYDHDKCWLFNGSFGNRGIVQYTTFNQVQYKPLENHCLNQREGSLFFNPIAKGNVTSILALEANALPYESIPAYYWLVASANKNEAMLLNQNVLELGPQHYMREIEKEELPLLHEDVTIKKMQSLSLLNK